MAFSCETNGHNYQVLDMPTIRNADGEPDEAIAFCTKCGEAIRIPLTLKGA